MGGVHFDLLNIPKKRILREDIESFINDSETKRINFASSHSNAFRRDTSNNDVVGWLNLPFDQPFECIASQELGIDRVLFKKINGKYYRRIDDEDSYIRFEGFIEKYHNLVFLRDCLDLSVALSMHESAEGVRTAIGEYEYKVKYRSNVEDVSEHKTALVSELQKRLEQLPFFKHADYVCCVPSAHPFMNEIVDELQGFAFSNISDMVMWENKDGSLKDIPTATEKLEKIDTWGFKITEDLDLTNKTVLLVDDMYQSGVTMQYVAMKLKEAGASRIYGMAIVKALSNN